MSKVIERHGYHVDDAGDIHYDDRATTIEAAENFAGRKLDRRKSYAIIDRTVCESVEWSEPCSGCFVSIDARGAGCHECAYSGMVRRKMWNPISH